MWALIRSPWGENSTEGPGLKLEGPGLKLGVGGERISTSEKNLLYHRNFGGVPKEAVLQGMEGYRQSKHTKVTRLIHRY